jgi:hypothetical protein
MNLLWVLARKYSKSSKVASVQLSAALDGRTFKPLFFCSALFYGDFSVDFLR